MGGRTKRSSHFQHTIIDLIITFSVQELRSCTEKLSGENYLFITGLHFMKNNYKCN